MRIPRAGIVVALAVGILTTPIPAGAQQVQKVQRIGYLAPGAPPAFRTFWEGMRELGYVVGQNVIVEYRWAEGQVGRLPDLAADLVRSNVEVIFASGYLATAAAKKASTSVPVVFSTHADPVEAGFVSSLARPGGHVTGLTLISPDLVGKRLELLREAVPTASRIAVLANTENPGSQSTLRHMESAARVLGITVQVLEGRSPQQFDGLFMEMVRRRAGGLHVQLDPLFFAHRQSIVDLAAKYRLPAMYDVREFVDAGGLMSYGPSIQDQIRRAGNFVGKILKGAKPADLPVEQPTKFELVINLKTAKTLGLAIPQSILIRADEVIQ